MTPDTNIPRANNLEEHIEKHFKESDDKTIKPISKEEDVASFDSGYKQDFSKASKDFWVRISPDYIRSYDKGESLGLYSGKGASVTELFRLIGLVIEECVKSEIETTEHGAEGLKDNFYSINIGLKLLEKELVKLKPKPDINSICSILHGFVNSYTESKVLKKKI